MEKSNSVGVCGQRTYQQIFMQHAEGLQRFLYYKTGDVATAEDLVQEAFIKLWNNCAKVLPEKAKSFLFTVSNNLFLDKVKHDKVVLKFQQRTGNTDVARETPEYLLEEKEFKEQLERAISELPEKQRIVFLMNRIDKITYNEMAVTLDVSVKTIEKRMSQALRQLRKLTKKI